ncbi:MAG: hypothetical protein FWD78_02235 [Treponema sp.]|nr:hypothetical protein [Treponema sp.]
MNKTVTVKVDAAINKGVLAHNWNYIGYDECNYTHSPGGMELLKKFGRLEKPYYVRAHHMLCTGNCHGQYKWGSTNAYTEDEAGNPVYDFTVIDKMCDIWLGSNCKPFFEIGFMPLDLADMTNLNGNADGTQITQWNRYSEYKRAGWNRPPKDYDKWYGLIRALTEHLLGRYGQAELETWYFEMWNEPDIFYWQGTHEQYCKLYDFTESAIHGVCPGLRFGGPATCGPLEKDSAPANFLRDFLLHVKSGKNYKTGGTGTRLDFTSFHTKGGGYTFTTKKDLEKTPSVKRLLDQVSIGAAIIKECGYSGLECILSEADPDGWAAGGRFDNPAFDFRNTEYYASYTACAYKNIAGIAAEMNMDIRPLAWAFMFEGERCFEGTRTFSTQGINKAVFYLFKMYAKLGDRLVEFKTATGAGAHRDADTNAGANAGTDAEINGWAVLNNNSALGVLIYCHQDTWADDDLYRIELNVKNLPFKGNCRVSRFLIDKNHSNAYAEWVCLGRPDWPDSVQYQAIKAKSELELAGPVQNTEAEDGKINLSFEMAVKSVTLIVIEQE